MSLRALTAPTTLGGVQLPAGARVLLPFAAANRDETAFAAAGTFNPERPNAADHLAFGQGVHYCLGAPLGRLEATIALRQIACRVSSVALAPATTSAISPASCCAGSSAGNFGCFQRTEGNSCQPRGRGARLMGRRGGYAAHLGAAHPPWRPLSPQLRRNSRALYRAHQDRGTRSARPAGHPALAAAGLSAAMTCS